MFRRSKPEVWQSFPNPELQEPILEFHNNEQGEVVTRYSGRRYLVNNFVLMEYADSFEAAAEFANMRAQEEDVRQDLS